MDGRTRLGRAGPVIGSGTEFSYAYATARSRLPVWDFQDERASPLLHCLRPKKSKHEQGALLAEVAHSPNAHR